ncbi:MAG TPA: hypothetical protein VM529_20760, partial [Gemmata sp.]|nr:hypothetical protein [Gemmata sp.]
MANTPHDEDPARKPRPNPDGYQPQDESLDQLPPLDPSLLESGELQDIDPGVLESQELPAGAFLEESFHGLPDARAPESGEVQYDAPPPSADPVAFGSGLTFDEAPSEMDIPALGSGAVPSDEFGSGTDWVPPALPEGAEDDSLAIPTHDSVPEMGSDLGMGSEHFAAADHDSSSLHLAMPTNDPVSGEMPAPDDLGSVPPGSGTFEPIAPAAGWLDSVDLIEPPEAEKAKGAGDATGSDIFGDGPVPAARPADPSDVIVATAFRDAAAARDDDRTELEEAAADELFADDPPPGLTFDSGRIADAPPLPDATEPVDVPEYGREPELTKDASSILADLDEADENATKDSSAVRLESPDVGATVSSDHGEGTEFDLTIGDALPHELIAEAASDHGSAEWEILPDADLFAAGDRPGRGAKPPAPQSSIFSDKPTNGGSEVRLDATSADDEGDSSVEFSDHPEAETEASASSILGRPPERPEPKPRSRHSSSDFEVPATEPGRKPDARPASGGIAGDSSILSRDSITQEDLQREA